ncbi:hypothetical protein AB0L70_32405 [Kribbella sp. NPDC051952]|uniref:hypothetical protein n=1 Tax=Kribbella sp. NPDC051952 TaxID=3154851 RepID=UPI00343EE928
MATDRVYELWRLAMVHGIVGFGTCLCLILLWVAGEPFGSINDVGNAVFGLLSAVLAWQLRTSAAVVFRALAAVGAVITVVGSILVLTDTTGYYLAGLVSSVGFALIGIWLIAANRTAAASVPRRLGLITGAVMALGLVGLPGVFMGLDDLNTAPGWTYVAESSWAGTYLLFPLWSLRLGPSAPRRH